MCVFAAVCDCVAENYDTMNQPMLADMTVVSDQLRFRMADESDIPAIVDLLKLGLGESRMPKSERYWRWKHVDNPFGQSYNLLATDDTGIVGIRSFMRWKWRSREREFDSVRGVDTVIHPDYQGQGIFGKLTLQLARHCQDQGVDFLFSTPNKGSNRAYTKLGWKEAGRLPVSLKVVRPFSLALNLLRKPTTEPGPRPTGDGSVRYYLNSAGLPDLLAAHDALHKQEIIAAHTLKTLQWRYQECPVAQYHASGVERGGRLRALLFYRMKQSRAGRELRITDTFIETHAEGKELERLVKTVAREQQATYITTGSFGLANIIPGWLTLPKRELGPIVTIHNIAMSDVSPFTGFAGWSPSLGDLELF